MTRSGGFSVVDMSELHGSSLVVGSMLMFVGGGSASTAGGIKVTTLAVLALAVWSEAKGRPSVEAFGRRIPSDVQRVALSVVAWGATIVALSTVTITQITQQPVEYVLFDVISGFATVGLSTGVTQQLPDSAVYVMALTMFMGRVGTVTLARPWPRHPVRSTTRCPWKGPSLVEQIRSDAPVLVIGLGRFGAACAGELDRLDREVLAIDDNLELVQKWSERVTHTVQADARNIEALKQIGAQDFQVAVVAVGSSIEASVLITANLVDLKVPQIWAKAVSQSHGKILARVGANHVIYPEREAGERVAHLVSGRMLDFIRFDDDFVLAKMYPPKFIRGIGLNESGVRSKYNVTVVGVKSPGKPFRYAEANTVVTNHDLIIVSGTNSDIERFASLDR